MKLMRQNANLEFHQLYVSVQQTAQAQNFNLEAPLLISRQANRCNITAATAEEYFRVAIFIPFLDNVIVALESRFTTHKSIVGGLQCLIPDNPAKGPTAKQIESIKVLGKFYENDLTKPPTELVPEFALWYRKLSGLNSDNRPTDLSSSIKECDSDAFPNIFTLLLISLTLPVTTCTSERSFPVLRRLKTYLRSTISSTRMNGLALLSIYRDLTPCPNDVLDRLCECKRRLALHLD